MERNSILCKLQRKTLIPAQLAGYALTLLVGSAIALLTLQLFADIHPMLNEQTDVFKAHTVTVSKNVTLFKTANKEGVYFDEKELQQLQQQDFVKNVAQFNSSTFNVSASITFGGQRFSTDLFFESVPDQYVDVESVEWQWDSSSNFLPIVIPEEYLNLYNFGFAESQSLPVVSEAMLSKVSFSIIISGNGRQRTYTSRIVGLSGKINSILVPEAFLLWANQQFGTKNNQAMVRKQPTCGHQTINHTSRLLVEFNDATDERIPAYFEDHGLNINKSELESSKMTFLFRLGMAFVFIVAIIIVVLSMAFIMMSISLIVQKNRDLFVNLYNIGYSIRQIAALYRWVISLLTMTVLAFAAVAALWVRGLYIERLSSVFQIAASSSLTVLASAALAIILLAIYNHLILRTIRHTVKD